jgi:hypothetical protein
MISPRTQALRFRIWAYCEPLGWNTTVLEIAEGLGEPVNVIVGAIAATGWTKRLRVGVKMSNRGEMTSRVASRLRSHELTARDVVAGRIGILVDV